MGAQATSQLFYNLLTALPKSEEAEDQGDDDLDGGGRSEQLEDHVSSEVEKRGATQHRGRGSGVEGPGTLEQHGEAGTKGVKKVKVDRNDAQK
jgi:hypothetical protein